MPGTLADLTPAQRATRLFEALARRDLSPSREWWGPDSVEHFVAVDEFRGHAQIRRFFEAIFAAFPDFTVEVERIAENLGEDVATVQWHARGTFCGAPFLEIEATGRAVELPGVDVIEYAPDGLIAHSTIYYDGADFARQIGLFPGRDSLADRGLVSAFNGLVRLRRAFRV